MRKLLINIIALLLLFPSISLAQAGWDGGGGGGGAEFESISDTTSVDKGLSDFYYYDTKFWVGNGTYLLQFIMQAGDTLRIVSPTIFYDVVIYNSTVYSTLVVADQDSAFVIHNDNEKIHAYFNHYDSSNVKIYFSSDEPVFDMISAIGDVAIKLTADATPSIIFTNSTGSDMGTIEMEANFFTFGSASESVRIFSDQSTGNISFISNEDKNFIYFVSIEFPNANDELTSSSAEQSMLAILSRYNQTSTASAVDFLVDRLENTVGSGTNLLADFRLL